jgi:Fe-Mn family superoxide dismutase
MKYEARNYDHLIGMEGFSETLLRNHFTLYNGYVTNTNALSEKLGAMATEGKFGPEYAELRRRYGWEWNGMRLHEFYFDNLGGAGKTNPGNTFTKAVTETWGNFENWKNEFLAIGAMRGIGWVVLYRDPTNGNLFNAWVNEHDSGHAAGATPVLVMDVFEHAFITDYGLKRADYLQAFWKNVNWTTVEKRLG